MINLGLADAARSGTEIHVGFRGGWIRYLSLTLGGGIAFGVAALFFNLAGRDPAQVFLLLQRWGVQGLLGLVAMLLFWDLVKRGLSHLGRLATAVQDSAVAIGRIADKDDRERDRMITETSFVGQRVERLAAEMREHREEQKETGERIELLLRSLQKQ